MREVNGIITIAFRDFLKFIRDRRRIIATFIFPIIFIGALGGSLQANLGKDIGYNFLTFTFTGVIGQILFQSTASGIISLIEDRENDFAQEIFISPVSRYSIIFGKILGESMVAMTQGVGVVIFGLIIGVPLSIAQFIHLLPVALVSCLFGGAFGVLVLANLGSQKSANQIFPFLIFPQFFLAGVFSPIKNLPLILDIFSHIAPMRYSVDLIRGIYYQGQPEYTKVVLNSPILNLLIIAGLFTIFLVSGTYLFIKNE